MSINDRPAQGGAPDQTIEVHVIPILSYGEVEKTDKLKTILVRELSIDEEIEESVRSIIEDVRKRGDEAVLYYTRRFDGVELKSVKKVPVSELRRLHTQVSKEFLEALRGAIHNVREFHSRQCREDIWVQKKGGIRMGLRFTPLGTVGLYVPGGTGAYPSTIVMNTVPAQVAGVERIVTVTPPAQFRSNPHVAAAFVELGIDEVYTIGGAQSIAALAYGTESIPRVDKIVGPGNMYVALAKRMVYGLVDIDMIAGPSEIVVVADETADPRYIAADLLSQAEHGSGMEMAVLLTTSRKLAEKVRVELSRQVEDLPNGKDVKRVLDANALIIVENLNEAAEAVNRIAPEHLELMVEEPYVLLEKIKNAGAIFIGPYSPEPISDYYGGTNHVLPTSGAARYASPLGVYDFQKCSNVVEYTKQAVYDCCRHVNILARAEGFVAHARSVSIRCEDNS